MTNILHIDSSARLAGSVTRELTAHAVSLLVKQNPLAKIIRRDLIKNPLPHIGADFLSGIGNKTPTPVESEVLARSEQLIAELEAADIIVIGAPMYNFSVPSQLKAWIDHVCRAGRTFSYTAEGPKGHLQNKRAIVVVGTGGVYNAGAMVAMDHVTSYLKQVLGFIGISDVTVVTAGKQAMGAEVATGELKAAYSVLEKNLGKAA